jgi:hypothetical protein
MKRTAHPVHAVEIPPYRAKHHRQRRFAGPLDVPVPRGCLNALAAARRAEYGPSLREHPNISGCVAMNRAKVIAAQPGETE